MANTDFLVPGDIGTACSELDQSGGMAVVLAGGTDLMVAVNAKKLSPEKVIYLGGCGLNRIEVAGVDLVIGAATTISALIKSDLVAQNAPLLADACKTIATGAVRNSATIGGNVCNASPAADGALALLALDAKVVIASSERERTLPIGEFFTGPGATVLKPGEIVKEFVVPVRKETGKSGWRKLGQRKAEVISVASAAICLDLVDGKCTSARIALGAVGPTPILATEAGQMLEGQALDEGLIAKVAQAAVAECSPIDDIRASAWYRKQIIAEMVTRILAEMA